MRPFVGIQRLRARLTGKRGTTVHILSWLSRPWARRSVLLVVQIALVAILVVLLVPHIWSTYKPPEAPQAGATTIGQLPRQLGSTNWEQLALPTPAADVLNVSVSPANPALLFACTAHLGRSLSGENVAAQ